MRLFLFGHDFENDDPVMCMSVRVDNDFKNSIHLYIFRSVFTMLNDIIFDKPKDSNLAISLHSLSAYTIYQNFPNGTEQIKIWSQPLPYMTYLLSEYVKINDDETISFCGVSFS